MILMFINRNKKICYRHYRRRQVIFYFLWKKISLPDEVLFFMKEIIPDVGDNDSRGNFCLGLKPDNHKLNIIVNNWTNWHVKTRTFKLTSLLIFYTSPILFRYILLKDFSNLLFPHLKRENKSFRKRYV